MKQNFAYILKEICSVWYLLPAGQLIADHKHAFKLNDTGVFIWNLLKEETTLDELLDTCAQYYQIPSTELESFRTDICQFVEVLRLHGILLEDHSTPAGISDKGLWLNIAGLICHISGPSNAISEELKKFSIDISDTSHKTDQRIVIVSHQPAMKENGQLLLRNQELMVMECEEKYILLFPTFPQIAEVHLLKDGSLATIYCQLSNTKENISLSECIFHVIRHAFLYLAQRKDMVAIHSSSILYKEKAWLFSAPSQTGKSTHANLWKHIANTPILNGDLNLIALSEHTPVIHGIPWCGTSGICSTQTIPLGGIILLKQSPSDKIQHLSEDQKRLLIMQRFISPTWKEDQLLKNLQLADRIADSSFICRLLCTPNETAMKAIRREMDAYIDSTN